MRYNLVSGAYTEPYKRVNCQNCVNWYPHILTPVEQHDTEDKIRYLKPTPGMKPFINVPGTRVRGLFSENDLCFFVVGQTLYQLIGDNPILRGEMTSFNPDDAQRVFMNINGNNQLGIFGGDTAYVYDINDETLVQITDIDFPGANGMDYMDGYGLVVRNGRVYFCELNDFLDWRGDNVFTPTYEADKAKRIIKLRGILWVFGGNTIEPYYNDGTTPFQRTPQASFDVGLLAPNSAVKYENGILFLGRSRRGSYGAYLLDSQNQLNIITPGSINYQLTKNAQSLDSAYGFLEQTTDSHIFYHIIIPDAGFCFSYDIISREWHERKSVVPWPDVRGAQIESQWRANCFAEYRGRMLVGDYYSGQIFELDYDTMTEDDLPIYRERTVGVVAEEQKRISVSDFGIDMQVLKSYVTDPVLIFQFSNDGGNTWHTERHIALPTTGNYGSRFRVRKLGSGFNLAFRLRLTDKVNLALIQGTTAGEVASR